MLFGEQKLKAQEILLFYRIYLEGNFFCVIFASAFALKNAFAIKEAFFEKDLHKTEVVQEACMAF